MLDPGICADPHLQRILRLARREELTSLLGFTLIPWYKKKAGSEEEESARLRAASLNREDLEQHLLKEIQAAGSHSIASVFRGHGVAYAEILKETLLHFKARKRTSLASFLSSPAAEIDRQQLLFAERELFRLIYDRDEIDETIKAALPDLNNQFVLYQFATLVAAGLAGRVAGSLLALSAELLLARSLPALAGPAGLGIALAWTLHQLSGPAMRKILPLTIHLALLDLQQSITPTVGFLGSMSAGKDSLMGALFDVDTGGVSPLPGSTAEVKVYEQVSGRGRLRLVNAPGSGDPRDLVAGEAQVAAALMDLAIIVLNAAGHLAGETALALIADLRKRRVPLLFVLNKVDLLKNEQEKSLLLAELSSRLGVKSEDIFCTVARPHAKLQVSGRGLTSLWEAIYAALPAERREALPRPHNLPE